MNINTLLKHEASIIHTNIRLFNKKNEIFIAYDNIDDFGLLNKNIQNKIYSLLVINKPILFCINNNYYYSTLLFKDGVVLCGPIYSSYVINLKNIPNFTIPNNKTINLEEKDIIDLLDTTVFINNMLNDADLTIEDYINNVFFNEDLNKIITKKISNIRYEFNEENKEHDSSEREKRLVHAIETGDIKLASRASMENIRGSHGVVSKDELQNNKLLAIVGITVASRAATNAGILSEVVLTLTDAYIQEINNAKDSPQIESIVYNCNLHLTKLVNEYLYSNNGNNENVSNYYSKKTKFYISNHLHNQIRIKDIANELKITPNYLSNLFKQSEGVTINDYILNEKISLAKSMLLYSDANNLEISSTLSFSSQSHFCKTFKKYTNTTPAEYRKNLK